MSTHAREETRTAEELVTALEMLPVEAMGDLDETMAGLTRSRLALTHMIAMHDAGQLRCRVLLLRVQRLIGIMERAHPNRWTPVPAGGIRQIDPGPRDGPTE